MTFNIGDHVKLTPKRGDGNGWYNKANRLRAATHTVGTVVRTEGYVMVEWPEQMLAVGYQPHELIGVDPEPTDPTEVLLRIAKAKLAEKRVIWDALNDKAHQIEAEIEKLGQKFEDADEAAAEAEQEYLDWEKTVKNLESN